MGNTQGKGGKSWVLGWGREGKLREKVEKLGGEWENWGEKEESWGFWAVVGREN